MADWENYVRRVVSRYKGLIRFYEIWNEPWFSEIESPLRRADGKAAFFSGSAAKMVELATTAYRVIKEVDPNARVVGPGFDHEEQGLKRLDLFLGLGGKHVVDIVGFHYYLKQPETIPALTRRLRGVLAKHGLEDRPIWNTESGYLIANPDEPELTKEGAAVQDYEAAGLVIRSLVLARSSGVSRFYWYGWDNGSRGLTRGRGATLNAAGAAYATARRWLLGATVGACQTMQGGIWVCPVDRLSRLSRVLWCPDGERDFVLPQEWAAVSYETRDGTEYLVRKDRTVKASPVPILITSGPQPQAMSQ